MLMELPGISEENELKPLLKKLLSSKDEVYKFAVVASGPREGRLLLDKKQKFKKKEVQEKAETDQESKKGAKFDVMTGECRLDPKNEATLRLIVYGKAPAKAVACVEHLLVRGPFKTVGFTGVILEEVEDGVADAPATPASGDEAAPDAPADAQADWNKAFADIEPGYLQGLRDRPDDASKLRAVMSFAQGKAETGNYPVAITALQKLAELLRSAPARPTSENQVASSETGAVKPPAGELAALFKERLTALLPDIKALAGTRAGDEARLLASEAGAFARKMDFLKASQLLDQAQQLLTKGAPAGAARQSEASPEALDGKAAPSPMGVVSYAKLLLRWREAQARAAANLTELGRLLLDLPEVQSDPRLAQVQQAAAGLPHLIPKFGEELADHLDMAANGGPNAADSRTAALATIGAYRKQLAAVPVLAKLGEFALRNLKADLPSAGELDAALGELEAALSVAR